MTFVWKLRYALAFRRMTLSTFAVAWQSAAASAEAFGTETDPIDAVHEELSYWMD